MKEQIIDAQKELEKGTPTSIELAHQAMDREAGCMGIQNHPLYHQLMEARKLWPSRSEETRMP